MSLGGIHRLGDRAGEGAQRPRMALLGCGGGGCNTLDRAMECGWELGHHVALNTDAQHLLSTRAHTKLLLGRELTRGRGTNMDIALGEQACREARSQISRVMASTDIVVILAGLGGGTGSGGAPVLVELARRAGTLSIALTTLPFSVEGCTRRDNAMVGQASLASKADVSVVLPNDHLLEGSPSLSLLEAFRATDEALLEPVRLLQRLMTLDDLPRVRTALKGLGAVHMGSAESIGGRDLGQALREAVDRLYPPVNLPGCTRALVMFRAGPDGPTDEELSELVRSLHLSLRRSARTLWGVVREDEMEGRLRVVVMVA